jgi:hypothetical protein
MYDPAYLLSILVDPGVELDNDHLGSLATLDFWHRVRVPNSGDDSVVGTAGIALDKTEAESASSASLHHRVRGRPTLCSRRI